MGRKRERRTDRKEENSCRFSNTLLISQEDLADERKTGKKENMKKGRDKLLDLADERKKRKKERKKKEKKIRPCS